MRERKPVTDKAKAVAKASLAPTKRTTRISNQVILDAVNPIPFDYTGSAFSFIDQEEYLPFLPVKDDYAQMLLEARFLSTTHNACITTKKDYCAGEGFMPRNGTDVNPAVLEWFASLNLHNEPVTEVNKKIFEDFFTWGNVPIELVRFTVAGKRRLFVYVHSMLDWRLCAPDKEGFIRFAVQSKLFLRSKYARAFDIKKAKKLPVYNPMRSEKENWLKDDKGAERTLIWYKNSVSGCAHYGLPSAVASMIYQLLEYKGARYNLDEFENNMVVAGILALKGSVSDAEATKIAKKIIQTHTGDGKRGRTVVIASEEGIDKADYMKMDTKRDGSFTEADQKWTEKIILANQWDAVLAGIVSPSTMGKGTGFITKIMELKLNTVIRPAQEDLVGKVWKHIFKIAAAWFTWAPADIDLKIKNGIDISGLTDVDITPAVMINEVRVAKGLPEDPKKKGEYMKSTAPAATTPPKEEGGDNV